MPAVVVVVLWYGLQFLMTLGTKVVDENAVGFVVNEDAQTINWKKINSRETDKKVVPLL